MISVKRRTQNEFLAVVEEGSSRTEHIVTLNEEYYEQLTGKDISKEALIKRTFEFLLAREPKESILRRFNLKVTNQYFPDFEKTISRRLLNE